MKSEGWREAARKAGKWFAWVEDGAEAYMRKWHVAEESNSAKRYATVSAVTRTVIHSLQVTIKTSLFGRA